MRTIDDRRGYLRAVGVFFFQAEDGIRDLTVTGVQTCALPISVLISLVRLASSFSLPATGKVPTFFGCSKFCSDDRRRSSHEFADLAHPGRCTSSCRRWPDSHLPRHRLRSSVARPGPDARG